jgi:hypothetical protein
MIEVVFRLVLLLDVLDQLQTMLRNAMDSMLLNLRRMHKFGIVR